MARIIASQRRKVSSGQHANTNLTTDLELVRGYAGHHDRRRRDLAQQMGTEGITRQEVLPYLVDFTASVAMALGGEDAVRACIIRLGDRIKDYREGNFRVKRGDPILQGRGIGFLAAGTSHSFEPPNYHDALEPENSLS